MAERPLGYMHQMSKGEIEEVQRALNWFLTTFLRGIEPLRVDGRRGPLTRRYIRYAKFYLGFEKKNSRSMKLTEDFWWQLGHPEKARKPVFRDRVRRGRRRRRRHNRLETFSGWQARFKRGVTTFDGKPVAKWMLPYLQWARENGWQGRLVSGWRSPWYSEQLCIAMCGRPTCPGRCAGRNSNHAQAEPPPGAMNAAMDVSDYVRFGQLMASAPVSPRLFNALGARDPVHFSPSGR